MSPGIVDGKIHLMTARFRIIVADVWVRLASVETETRAESGSGHVHGANSDIFALSSGLDSERIMEDNFDSWRQILLGCA